MGRVTPRKPIFATRWISAIARSTSEVKIAAIGDMKSLYWPKTSHAQSFQTRHCALPNSASWVAHIGEALVGEDDFGVDAVAGVVTDAIERIAAGVAAQAILAALRRVIDGNRADARALIALDDHPLLAFLIDFDMRQALAKFFIEALIQKRAGLVGVAVRRDHQVFGGIAGTRGARPSADGRGFRAASDSFRQPE